METPVQTKKKEKILGLFRPKFGSRSVYNEADEKESALTSEVDYSVIKVIAVIAVTSLLVFFFGYSLSYWSALRSGVIGLISVSFIILFPLLIKAKWLNFIGALAIVLSLGTSLLIFGKAPLIPIVALSIFSLIVLIEGFLRGRAEINNSLKMNFIKFSGKILSGTLTIISLAFAIYYGFNFKVDDLFSEKFLDGALSIASPLINYYSPGFSPEMKFNEFLQVSARRILLKESSEFAFMPEPIKETLTNEKALKLKEVLEKDFAVKINPEAAFKDNFRVAVTDKFYSPAKNIFSDHLSIIAAVFIFSIIRGIFWVFGWISAAFAFFIYQFLLATKFAEIYLESKNREMVLLK